MFKRTLTQGNSLISLALSLGAALSTLALSGCGGGNLAESAPTEIASAQTQPLGQIASSGLYLSPAQVRTRYGFDGLPDTPEAKGSGQLIAVVGAYNNIHLADNLRAFSARYNLPQCKVIETVITEAPGQYPSLNINHPKPGDGCSFQVISLGANGKPLSKASLAHLPTGAVASAWTGELSMDIEWIHAMAPQASIIVVQAEVPMVATIMGVLMGAGDIADVVSMSFGADERSYQCPRRPGQPTVKYDPNCSDSAQEAKSWSAFNGYAFRNGKTTFVAASGDQGVTQWPSIAPAVLAVGGTVAGSSMDTGWGGSGGGVTSLPAPVWQPVFSGSSNRTVPDVAYDAGTAIAIYLTPDAAYGWADASCVKANGTANCGWYGAGGTSAGAPQWAALAAITRAMRLGAGKPAIDISSSLYGVASVPGMYVTAFGDVLAGNTRYNATKRGYDMVTGLGTPNASVLVNYLNAL